MPEPRRRAASANSSACIVIPRPHGSVDDAMPVTAEARA
jgi:hypothetical protein